MLALMKARGMTARDPILIRIHKQESELELWKRDRSGRYALLKTYPMCRWSGKLGPKMAEGDRQAPEGFYEVTASMLNPRSQFNLSFNLGFPNRLEKSLGWQGSALMVHGACSSSGCYAMTDQAIGEIYAVAREALAAGQASFQVQALPFRMTAENLALHRNDPNLPFWRNLKQGSDRFALSRQPPVIGYCGKRYIFDAQAADGMAMDPLSPCPVLQQADPSLEDKLAELTRTDASRLAASGGPVMAMTYTDGGMHPVFRDILRTSGPDRLSKMTSSKVKVSRPQAALADPYRAGSAGH
jgi:murein L,D-transpeptidase YafK